MATLKFNKYLVEQISSRYAIFEKENDGKSNLIIDSYSPSIIVNKLLGKSVESLPQTSYAISEFFADEFQVRQIPFEYLIEILGYKKKEIADLLLKVKKKKLNLLFVGFGGTGANTWHWISQMLIWTGQVNLFRYVSVYDDDRVDLTNILRFPFNLDKVSSKSARKVNMCTNYGRISANNIYKYNGKLSFKGNGHTEDYCLTTEILKDKKDDSYRQVLPKDETVIYGAPDLSSRKEFADYNFMSATHGDDECSLIIKPLIDTDIQVESYGLIRLSSFFMNQLMMSIAFLEFLSSDDEEKWNKPSEEIFKFNFKDYIEEGNGKVKDKVLNWQIAHSGLRTYLEGENNVG